MSTILGIDIGGTGIKAAPVSTITGKLLAPRIKIDTPKGGKPGDICNVLYSLVEAFPKDGKYKYERIGCTFPCVVQRGVVKTAANISKDWIDINAEKLLSKKLKLPVLAVNDADAAGIAEVRFGAGKNTSGLVLIVTLGTGIGTALFFNKQLVPNSELGHLQLFGCDAEKIASNRVREEENQSWKKWSKGVSDYLKHLEDLLWPELIIIGGGVSKEASKFIPLLKTRTQVIPAKLRNDAGIVGAALYAEETKSS